MQVTNREHTALLLAAAMSIHAASCGRADDASDSSVGAGTTSTSGASSGASSGAPSDDGSTSGGTTGSGDTTGAPAPIEPVVAMTFNVLCALCSSGFEPWAARVPYMADTIERHAPQLVGLQEVLTAEEVEEIRAALGGAYEAIYFDGDNEYADALVFYDPGRFAPIEDGELWLSPTPDVPFSTGFADGFQLARLLVWVRFTDLPSGRELLFATTHFDNNSPSQELSAPLVLERIEALGGAELPTIVVGDFNAQPSDLAYEILTQGETRGGYRFDDVFALTRDWSIETNEDPTPAWDPAARIDHIFVSGAAWSSPWWAVDIHTYGPDALYVSDHFAMAAELTAE